MNEEIWKDVVGYEGLYKVSNKGNVFSNYVNRQLKPGTHKDGYRFLILRKEGKEKYCLIHRLVAEAFLDNPNNLLVINHKDENPSNNCVDNLEWCTFAYNNTYNDVHIKRAESLTKNVFAYNENGDLVYEYDSIHNVARDLNLNNSNIVACCMGDSLTYKNLVWSYEKLSKQEVSNKFEQSNRYGKKRSIIINQFDLNGNFINHYDSIREAERQLGINRYHISSVCRGQRKSINGFIFEYDDAS